MKTDFALARQELNGIGILRVCRDFYSEPIKKGSVFFVRSPAGCDKTASLAIYPQSNRFCDFSNANKSGDIVGLVAYTRNCNQWQALQELRDYYGLTDARQQEHEEVQRRIQLQQEQERRKRERRQAFYTALNGETDRLKQWYDNLSMAMEKSLYEPLSELHAYIINERQITEYKLDILTAQDMKAYPRLKPYQANLSTDRFEWLLDCLAILKESGAFEATADEMAEIKAQRDFELLRKPGQNRGCALQW